MIMFGFFGLFSFLTRIYIPSSDIILDLPSNSELLNKTSNKNLKTNNLAKHWEFRGCTWKSNVAERA